MTYKRCEEIPTDERNFDNTGNAVYRVCQFLSARSICECHIIYRAALKECRILDQSCQWPFAMTRLTQYRGYNTLNFQLT